MTARQQSGVQDSPAAVSLAAKIEGAIRGVNELAAWQEQQLMQAALLGRTNTPYCRPRPPLPRSPPPPRSLSSLQVSQPQFQQQLQQPRHLSHSRPPLPPGPPPPPQSPQRPPSSHGHQSQDPQPQPHPEPQTQAWPQMWPHNRSSLSQNPHAQPRLPPAVDPAVDTRQGATSNTEPKSSSIPKRLQQFRVARRQSKAEAAESRDAANVGVSGVRQMFSRSASPSSMSMHMGGYLSQGNNRTVLGTSSAAESAALHFRLDTNPNPVPELSAETSSASVVSTDSMGTPSAAAEAAVSHALEARRKALALLEEHQVHASYSPELAQKALHRVHEQDLRREHANVYHNQ